MKEMMKNVVYAGLGAAFLTKEKIEELRSEFIEKGKISQDEGKQFVDELVSKSEKAKEQLNLWINRRVEEKVKHLNLATVDEVNELRRQIAELQVALNMKVGSE
jgi:polyhydroxyalkanoate synthesis regulator phasin